MSHPAPAPGTDTAFAGSIPLLYERHLVPLFFAPYAQDLARRAVARMPQRVLELAAGTGALTRQLAAQLPATATIVATDLNAPMLEVAIHSPMARTVQWQQADAMQLPFQDGSFDLVVCQFGVMFFPDKGVALGQARRVLRAGGALLFNTWGAVEQNAFTATVEQALAEVFPTDPPRFMQRIPHGYHDEAQIAEDLRRAGFEQPAQFTWVQERSRAASPHLTAMAICQGTPLRHEIEARDPSRLEQATAVATAALTRAFGPGPIEAPMQALVVMAVR